MKTLPTPLPAVPLFVVVFLLSAMMRPMIGSAADPLRVMTWNLEWFYDENSDDNFSDLAKEKSSPSRSDWDWKRDAVADSIAKIRPDIVAVQEVENRRVLWYLSRSIQKNFEIDYNELALEGQDFFTEQDVGFLLRRDTADLITQSLLNLRRSQRDDERLMDLSKHMMIEVEVTPAGGGDASEIITLFNLHLRATEKAVELRRRQSRLMHQWIAAKVAAGENVIVLGDFNTEVRADRPKRDDDLSIAMGFETSDRRDDLFDVSTTINPRERQTHVLPGRVFDRILVSKSLTQDDPSKIDLVFRSAAVRSDLAIRGRADTPDDHWENYWQRDASQRDISDHYPVIAEFDWR